MRPLPLDRPRLARWALLYAVGVIYGSLVVGPVGFHFVPQDPVATWHRFLLTRYLDLGSDQRPDWMANLLMLIPLGFLVTGALTPARGRVLGAAAGFVLSLLFVLIVKYAQLFFPPRTVTINYIAAQGIGAALGTAGFALGRDRLVARVHGRLARGGRAGLRALLGVYACGLLVFMLLPFDVVLSLSHLHQRLAALPALLWALPGADRPAPLRVALILADMVAVAPVGALLALAWPRRGLGWIAGAALLVALGMVVLELPILSATPMLGAIVYRATGMLAGAVLLRRLRPAGLERLRAGLARAVPWLWLPYLLLLAYANALLARHWRTPAQALAALDWRGLIPLWHDYIVAKTAAAKSTVVHLMMYAPIGAMVWLRGGTGRRAAWGAGGLAALVSLAVELGRWFRPGLQPDFNDMAIGGLAAFLAVQWLPWLWAILLDGVAGPGATLSSPVAGPPTAAPEAVPEGPPGGGTARAVAAAACLAGVALFLVRYPLPPAPLAVLLALYAAALWRWPGLWLVAMPAVLPAFDLTVWSGWLMATESDAFLLLTAAVLLLRAPPRWQDIRLRGIPGAVLAVTLAVLVVEVLRGLTSAHGLAHGSSDPYLRPINALRLAKGEAWAFVLLPFLRARWRQRGDALILLGAGMMLGLAAVASAGILERALFPGVFNFHSFYRIAATFSSVQFGSDDIGTYLAMTLPFLALGVARPRPALVAAAVVVGLMGGYALLVTYSRTAYGAAVLGALATGVLLWPRGRGRRVGAGLLAVAMFGGLAGVTLGFAADSHVMKTRLSEVLPDFRARWDNWAGGLAMMDRTGTALVLGMGLGTYPRVARARAPLPLQPTNDVVLRDAGRRLLRLRSGSSFYFGQKVPVRPGVAYRLSLWFRLVSPGAHLGVALCEKLLLYSEACNGAVLPPAAPGVWVHAAVPLSSVGLDRRVVLGVLRRPLELALFATGPGETVEFTQVRLRGPHGREVLRNGDFRDGTVRWYPTDDTHLAWTIWNQYAITLFEGGALGLLAYLTLGVAALGGAAAAALRGEAMAASVAGALLAFLAAGVFDDELAAPRMATLFYLMAFVGVALWGGADGGG